MLAKHVGEHLLCLFETRDAFFFGQDDINLELDAASWILEIQMPLAIFRIFLSVSIWKERSEKGVSLIFFHCLSRLN